MGSRKIALAAAVGAALGVSTSAVNAEVGEIKWFGSVYAKFLDGDRRLESALYNNAETTPGEAGGDQGQGIEFELMFNSQVSRQVEIGGRIKARFNKNFWTNFGGFGPEENDPRSAQYMKLRGVWATITPGYDWIDSATIGSNDFGMFDPFTVGKFRYIDRDNASGLLFQGSAANNDIRWDFARVSLARLFQGPRFVTTPNPNSPDKLETNDAAWIAQVRWAASTDLNLTGIVEYIRDKEIAENELGPSDSLGGDPDGEDILDGTDVVTRYDNTIVALKGNYSGFDAVDIGGSFYWSDFTIDSTECDMTLNGNCRFSPTLQDDGDDVAWILNFDINETPVEDLTFNLQFFHIGAEYQSVTAARRESDVLLTEGRDATWGWGRPQYNFGNRSNANALAGIGYGGWNGETHQVVSGMVDTDFTDFDEPYAESVIGWKGFTIVPKYVLGDWEFSAEYSYIDFDTNWQACGNADKDMGCKFSRMEGTHSWGLGGDFRSPYAPFQDKEMQILALQANYVWDVGNGVDLMAKYKYVNDEDNRVTDASRLTDAYDGYVEGVINPNYTPVVGLNGCTSCDDREADYHHLTLSAGYQVHPDLYAKLIYARHEVDLVDGTIDVAPVGLGFEGSNDFGWIEYLTGEHEKNRIGLELNYFLSGVEFGASVDWLWGEFDPIFLVDDGNGNVTRINPADTRIITNAAGRSAVVTPLGDIEMRGNDLEQYRLKAFMKVSF